MKQPLNVYVSGVSAGGTYDEVEAERVPRGEIWLLRSISFVDLDNALTGNADIRVNLGIGHIKVASYATPSAGFVTNHSCYLVLRPGNALTVRFTGATSGDRLEVFASGWRYALDCEE
ncbi:MAG: hypothetical protein ACE5K8_04650 [Candidatus Zixiibacteriota bacterium]